MYTDYHSTGTMAFFGYVAVHFACHKNAASPTEGRIQTTIWERYKAGLSGGCTSVQCAELFNGRLRDSGRASFVKWLPFIHLGL